MLRTPEGSLVSVRNKPLSIKTIKRIIGIFSGKITELGVIHRNTSSQSSQWLYAQPNFTPEQAGLLDDILGKIGLKLAKRYANLNSLLCYRRVDPHHDREISVGTMKIKIDDCSFVFVPLYGHEGGCFIIGDDGEKVTSAISDGSILIFDHNIEHEVRFPVANDKLKFGLSFLVDKIIQSPPSASSHPQGPLSP